MASTCIFMLSHHVNSYHILSTCALYSTQQCINIDMCTIVPNQTLLIYFSIEDWTLLVHHTQFSEMKACNTHTQSINELSNHNTLDNYRVYRHVDPSRSNLHYLNLSVLLSLLMLDESIYKSSRSSVDISQ